MIDFWLKLWFRWTVWLSVASLFWALVVTVGTVGIVYMFKGMPPLDEAVQGALLELGQVFFALGWSATFLLSFVVSVKKLFGYCIRGRRLGLFECETQEEIPSPTLADTAPLWRKWFFVMIWMVAAEMVVAFAVGSVVLEEGFGSWFSIYWLYGFVLLGGAVSMPMIPSRCQRVKVLPC